MRSVLVLLLVAVVVAAAEASLEPASREKPLFVVILDECYNATRVKVIRRRGVPSPNQNNQALILSKKISPGLKELLGDRDRLRRHLQRAVAEASNVVPEDLRAKTPLTFIGSSGMRHLPLHKISAILEAAKNELSDPEVNPSFQFNRTCVRLLSGEQEAVSAFVSANFNKNPSMTMRSRKQTVGLLDCNEYSAQIAFMPKDGLVLAESYPAQYLKERQQQPYVQNYLGAGTESIKWSIAFHLLMTSKGSQPVKNPCMLKGDSATTHLEAENVQQEGSGDPEKCQELLKQILKPARGVDCLPKPCAIGPKYQPSVQGVHFEATKGCHRSVKALEVENENDRQLRIELLEQKAFDYCRKTLEQVVNNQEIPASEASQICLEGIMIPTLLKHSFGFDPSSSDIHVNSTVHGGNSDWSLGAVLLMEGSFSEES